MPEWHTSLIEPRRDCRRQKFVSHAARG
jgi:hypothetical protein